MTSHGIVPERDSPSVLSGRLRERFDAKVDRSGTCWIWNGARQSGGYGHISINNRMVLAHRFSFEDVNGPIPEGLVIDHLCGAPSCVNPDHLQAVTQRINSLRSDSPAAQNARKSACVAGHPFIPENTGGSEADRYCLACKTITGRKRSLERGQRVRTIKPTEPNPIILDLARAGRLPGMTGAEINRLQEQVL